MRSFDPETTSSSTDSSVLRLLRPGPAATAALTAAIAAATALPLAAPQVTRRFVDDAIGGASTRHLTLIALGYLALAVAGQAARMLTAWLAGRLAWDGTNRLRERLTGHALGLDLAFHGRHTPGELIERVDGDVVAVADFVVAFLLDVVASVLLLAGVVVVVFTVDWRIGAVLLAYCLLVGYGMARAQRLAVPSAARSRAASATLFGTLEERLAGAEDLRANGAGEHTVRRFHQVSAALFRAEHRDARIGTTLLAGTSVAFAAGTAVMLALAAWATRAGTLTVGTAVLLFQYTLMVRAPFERLIDQIRQYQAALAGLARIAALLAERPALTPGTRPLPAAGPLGLRVEGAGFRYPDDDEQVLSGIDLTLAPGETLGLVGRTGSGKTTLARLVLRLHDPVEGVVRVGGVDLREADPRSLRARIGVVTQDVQLFAASVRDNLTLFRPSPGDERLMEVLRGVGLGEWAAALPDGLGTELRAVSAGQAQLIAFARAFLADPGLVVLDEASSRLDPATERRIEDSIARLLDGRTGVIIAHRLSSLSRVDKIAVLDRGKIVEYGRRDELAANPDSRFGRLLDRAGVPR
ncbi:ABC transporter ATP-binding protein [Nonomuraea gerenzanensis]|uniref:ABC transporter ATP-binding protein n=1 Tax=Nonomuraea gerenzanensis TaxID=93944 RepID=UPI001CD95A0F|nr:ABC transporter ATP-binding protein [Nonomuraea gerenzanensis]UBU09693.1 ABC transporter ATP-binding protein/permease [Nonomuraea gerenzanensis]